MARDDDGQVYLPAWRRAYDRLVKMLHQAYAQAEELSVEREHLIAEVQFLQSASRERNEISQARLQQVRTIRVLALCLCDWIWGRPSLGRRSRALGFFFPFPLRPFYFQICKDEELSKRVLEAETAARLGGKELQIHCHQKLAGEEGEGPSSWPLHQLFLFEFHRYLWCAFKILD
jgi:hypothetical protein